MLDTLPTLHTAPASCGKQSFTHTSVIHRSCINLLETDVQYSDMLRAVIRGVFTFGAVRTHTTDHDAVALK